jgi:hypothetical protein
VDPATTYGSPARPWAPPAGVMLSAGFLITQFALTIGVWFYLPKIWRHMGFGYQGVCLVQLAWTLLVGLALPAALLLRQRWAWSATTASLLIAGARGLASVAVSLTPGALASRQPVPGSSTQALLASVWSEPAWVLGAGLALALLLRNNEWFGIEPRQESRTLLQEGGWALLLSTTVLFGSWVLLWLRVL